MNIDLLKELGAEEETSAQRLTVYLPNKDRDGHELSDLYRWVDQVRELLSRIGGGATAFPPADGTWLKDDGSYLWEQTRLVYCFVRADRFTVMIASVREFLHRFGRETNQGEVVAEFDGRFYRIRRFDPPTGA